MKTYDVRCAGSYHGSRHSCTIFIGPAEWGPGAKSEEFDKDAQILCDALRDCLPVGVLNRFLDKMNEARARDEAEWSKKAKKR